MNQTNIKIGQLRDRMKELGIDAYLVPTADFHESEYVGEFFKCRHFLTGFNGTAGTAVTLWTKPDSGQTEDTLYRQKSSFQAVRSNYTAWVNLNSRLWTSF